MKNHLLRMALLAALLVVVCGIEAWTQGEEAPPPEEASPMEMAPEEAPPVEAAPEEAPAEEFFEAPDETAVFEEISESPTMEDIPVEGEAAPTEMFEGVSAEPGEYTDMQPADETTGTALDATEAADTLEPAAPLATNAMAELIELKPETGAEPSGDTFQKSTTGEALISVTLDNVPLQDVMRMFARISGANIVSGTNLQGNITVSLKDVEWQPALRTILDTAGMTLVMKSPGIYSVVSKQEAAAAPVTVDTVYLKFTTVSNVLPIVQKMLISSNSSAAGFPSANAIVIQETSERLDSIKDIIVRIDKPRPQVFIEAKFVELNDEAIKNLGINWQSLAGYTLTAKNLLWSLDEKREYKTTRTDSLEQYDNRSKLDGVNKSYDIDGLDSATLEGPQSFLDNSVDGTIGRVHQDKIEQGRNVGLNVEDAFTKTVTDARAAVLSAADFQVTLSALKTETGVSVVSNPRIIVASGETARIHVGRKDPNYVTVDKPGSAGGTVITTRELDQTTPFIETGVKVDVQPTVNTESNITVKIAPELSRILAGGKEGDIPPIATRTILSEFNLESGRTVAIGGLTSTDDREIVNKIPVLGDIPLIGKYLFRHTKTQKIQEEVIIFVTVGLATPESLSSSAGIPSEGKLIHRHLAREATQVEGASRK